MNIIQNQSILITQSVIDIDNLIDNVGFRFSVEYCIKIVYLGSWDKTIFDLVVQYY